MRTHWGTATDAGGRRSANEDAALAEPPVFAVADGMGGHARGDMASQAVVAALAALAREVGAERAVRPADLEQAVRRGGEQIQRTMAETVATSRSPLELQDSVAGTTVSGVALTEDSGHPAWLVFNVGDSRVYRLTDHTLEQVSTDHSLVQEMVDAGTISREEARSHPQRNVITRAVGTGPAPEMDFWVLPAQPGDRFLLCTDGLFGELSEQEITEVLLAEPDPGRAAERLVAEAVADTANDNVTVVVLDSRD